MEEVGFAVMLVCMTISAYIVGYWVGREDEEEAVEIKTMREEHDFSSAEKGKYASGRRISREEALKVAGEVLRKAEEERKEQNTGDHK